MMLGPHLEFISHCVKNYQYRTEGQNSHQILAPKLVIMLWNSLVIPRKVNTSSDSYRYGVGASTSSGKTSVSYSLCYAMRYEDPSPFPRGQIAPRIQYTTFILEKFGGYAM